MTKPRNTYKYQFKVGNKIVYVGTTSNLKHRERDHKRNWPEGHIVRIGHKTTEDAARKWEEKHVRVVKSARYSHSKSLSQSTVAKAVRKMTSSRKGRATTSEHTRAGKKA